MMVRSQSGWIRNNGKGEVNLKIRSFVMGLLGENCYALTDETSGQTAIIDPGAMTAEFEAYLKALPAGSVPYILLTHGHFDHILGAAHVQRLTGAKIIIHELDAPCLTDETASMADYEYPGIQEYVQADRLVHDGDEIVLGALTLRVMHTPGHTRGGVCYVCGDVIFSGDTLFCHTCGRTDFPGGSTEEMLASLHHLAELEGNYEVYPGHNRATTLDEERVKNRYMRKFS